MTDCRLLRGPSISGERLRVVGTPSRLHNPIPRAPHSAQEGAPALQHARVDAPLSRRQYFVPKPALSTTILYIYKFLALCCSSFMCLI